MKLVVLAGAKSGAAVPIKKTQFVIGRSKGCALRAGSEAISRRHCEIRHEDGAVTVQDLGSRNGTYVNGEKIEGVRPLENGDTLKIGPLEFRFEFEPALKQVKAPKVNGVGDAVSRVAAKAGGGLQEDDISDWLINDAASDDLPSMGETLSLRTDETRISGPDAGESLAEPAETQELVPEEAEAEAPKKQEPGKLPFRPDKPQAKDSREAAMQVLRDMARRR